MSEASGVAAVDPLDAVAVRVLGCLVEKAFTTPDNYPLTLNALTAACNQTSNREPVMSLDEATAMAGLRSLMDRALAREVYRSDSRVKRYRHLLEETLHLHDPERAILCVLLLRGPQTPGELKTRTARMFEFIDLTHIEITLQSLMTLATPLAVQLPRQPGQKEARYAHLLAGEPPAPQPSTGSPEAYESPDVQRGQRPGHMAAGSPAASPRSAGGGAAGGADGDRLAALEQEVASLREELAQVRAELHAFRQEFQ